MAFSMPDRVAGQIVISMLQRQAFLMGEQFNDFLQFKKDVLLMLISL
jgi:hypothetical protein